jgi:hypothetical protein
MRLSSVLRMAAVLPVAGLLLAACGGGGGGSVGGGPTVTLSGKASFDLVPSNGAQGALNYNAISAKPVRGAVVDVIGADGDTLLASTSTDEQGAYSVQVPANRAIRVRVRAQSIASGPGAKWEVSVRDNTQGNAIYAMESPPFGSEAADTTRDVHAPSGWGGRRYTGQRVAGPFAILDTVQQAMAKVRTVAPDASFPPLRLFWSADNVPASGSVAQGQIGTTSYTNDSAGAAIFVLGKEDVDTDEYDDSVIAHEWGHYYQHAFSRDDSPGGPHGFNDRLDQRLAFSEGWGNAWSGMVLGKSHYTDSLGPGQGPGTDLDLSAGGPSPAGWYREASIQSVLWRLHSLHGFAPIHQAMSGPLRTTPALTTIHSFAAAYGAVLPSSRSELSALLAGQAISGVTNDPWGSQENNDGGLPNLVLPLYKGLTVGAPFSGACVSNAFGSDNKLGSFVYLRYTIQTAGRYNVSVSGQGNVDPDFDVYAGARLASATGLGASESLAVSLPAGDVVVALQDANNSSDRTCFQINVHP